MNVITISFFRNDLELSLLRRKETSKFTNMGFLHKEATKRAIDEVSTVKSTQILHISNISEAQPINKLIADLANGRTFSFSVQTLD